MGVMGIMGIMGGVSHTGDDGRCEPYGCFLGKNN